VAIDWAHRADPERYAEGIQPHGVLLVFDELLERLQYASANAAHCLGIDAALARGASLESLVGAGPAHDIRNAAMRATTPQAGSYILGLRIGSEQCQVDCRVHAFRGRTMIELEHRTSDDIGSDAVLSLAHTLISRLGKETTLAGLAAAGARFMRIIANCDRVSVVRFGPAGPCADNCSVLAEAGAGFTRDGPPELPGYLVSSRDGSLPSPNPLRIVADASKSSVPLLPTPEAGAPVDISYTHLRAPSAADRAFLRASGALAHFSMPIVGLSTDGTTACWGVIRCESDRAQILSISRRMAAELFGRVFSVQLQGIERQILHDAGHRVAQQIATIAAGLGPGDSIEHALLPQLGALVSLLDCDGVGLWSEGQWHDHGAALTPSQVRTLLDADPWEESAPVSVMSPRLELAQHGSRACAMKIRLSDAPCSALIYFRFAGNFHQPDIAIAHMIRAHLADHWRSHVHTTNDQARLERRWKILNAEMNHRVKNIIALVKAIATQGTTGADSVQDYANTLEGRLIALSVAHDQFYSGEHGGDLSALINAELNLYRDERKSGRLRLEGPSVRLDDQAFSALALVMHEMMTNAAKYGALSTASGQLEITWWIDAAGDCELAWSETGGPAVEPPTKLGFGSKLIESMIQYDLGGQAQRIYAKTGLQARFVIPAAHLQGACSPRPAAPPTMTAPLMLNGISILIVEDQSLIAMDVDALLRSLGASDVRLSPDPADAVRQLAEFRPDVAVLDINLGLATSEIVAEALIARDVPFVFATGYGDNVMLPEHLQHIPVIRKPIRPASVSVLISVLNREASTRLDDVTV
jgi:light-regulated signal transduction histidine kinase (bacteriophytochrome)/CheY-like chemotaxis protein